MANKIELKIISESLKVGTRPHWDAATKSLYYVDIPASTVYKYEPQSEKTTKAKVGTGNLSFMFPIEGKQNKFIAAIDRNFAVVTWDGKSDTVTSIETVGEVDAEKDLVGNRLNGGKVDPYGRLWAGTMGPADSHGQTIPNRGSLYSLSSKSVKKHLSNIGISNGLAWNTKTNKMYYVDTLFPGLYQFDYDPATGNIENKNVVFEFSKHKIPGLPDGLLIDTDDKLWIAVIHGSRVIRIDPNTGELLQTILFPTPQVTAIAFGGENLDILYVTTAKITIDEKTPEYPAGCTYAVSGLPAKGLPGDYFKL